MYIDAHCHLADPRLDSVRERVLEESAKQGVGGYVQGGVDPEDWERQLALKAKYPDRIYCSFGLHPWWVAELAHLEEAAFQRESVRALELLDRSVAMPEAVALGELGLDFGKRTSESTHGRQRVVFIQQLEIARRHGKPLVLHIVRAHDEAIRILKEHGVPTRGGIVHSFSGNGRAAREYLDLGLSLSISGAITGKGFENLKRAVVKTPLQRLMIESDAPDQKPAPCQGRPDGLPGELNDPASIRVIAAALSRMRDSQLHPSRFQLSGDRGAEALLAQSTENVRRMFGL